MNNIWKPNGDDERNYFAVNLNENLRCVSVSTEVWENSFSDNEKYERNLVFKTKEEAEERAKVLRKQFMPIFLTHHIPNIFEDNIAFVQKWDFSRANASVENRIMAITQVASICYQSPKALGSESLYNRLAAESQGLPSSSFEFVPVLLDPNRIEANKLLQDTRSNVRKFGEWVIFTDLNGNKREALLTNYRAIYYDYEEALKLALEGYQNNNKEYDEKAVKDYYTDLYLNFFNDETECKCIADNFNVYLYKVDFPTRSQMVRHRVNWQELSRRYVSGERVPFDFYISEKMEDITSKYNTTAISNNDSTHKWEDAYIEVNTEKVIDICLEHYYEALKRGVKPQEARRIIPQAAYTQIWGAFMPSQLENYFKLRDDNHAQWEIRQTAIAMKSTLGNSHMEITPEREEELLGRLEEIKNGTAMFVSKEEIESLLDAVDAMNDNEVANILKVDNDELDNAREYAKRNGISNYEVEEL